MKKIIPVVLALCVAVVSLHAQNPGYMGRHVLVNAECSLSPSLKKPNPLGEALAGVVSKSSTLNYLGLNYIVSPNVEVIVWRKGTVGVGYNFFKSPFNYKCYFETENPIPEFYYYDNVVYWEGTADMTAHGFNMFYKQYVGRTLAPMGQYFKFTFDGFFYQYKARDLMLYPEDLKELETQMKGKNMLFGLKAEYGYDYLLCDFLRLSIGVSVGTTLGGYKVITKKYNVTGIDMDCYAKNRILGAYWFGFKLGIGFLTF